MLSAGVRTDQPKEVRLEAIDAMSDTEDKRAIQLLQGLLGDPDEEIREAAQDSIDIAQGDGRTAADAAKIVVDGEG